MKEKYYDDINLGILKYIYSGFKILDVGCGTGLLGYEMKKKGNYVYGVDISKKELDMTSKRLNYVKNIDITKHEIILPKDFDIIVFADVLEHLKDPLSCLKNFKNYLKVNGEIIVSLPNVACYNVRLSLLLGRFNYKKYGILDDTHLRFFTKKTARQLIEDAGYRILKVDTTPYFIRPLFHIYRKMFLKGKKDRNINTSIFNSNVFKLYQNYVFPIENLITKLWAGLLAYQFIIIAKKR